MPTPAAALRCHYAPSKLRNHQQVTKASGITGKDETFYGHVNDLEPLGHEADVNVLQVSAQKHLFLRESLLNPEVVLCGLTINPF